MLHLYPGHKKEQMKNLICYLGRDIVTSHHITGFLEIKLRYRELEFLLELLSMLLQINILPKSLE